MSRTKALVAVQFSFLSVYLSPTWLSLLCRQQVEKPKKCFQLVDVSISIASQLMSAEVLSVSWCQQKCCQAADVNRSTVNKSSPVSRSAVSHSSPASSWVQLVQVPLLETSSIKCWKSARWQQTTAVVESLRLKTFNAMRLGGQVMVIETQRVKCQSVRDTESHKFRDLESERVR